MESSLDETKSEEVKKQLREERKVRIENLKSQDLQEEKENRGDMEESADDELVNVKNNIY